ncbi:MAG TPA: CoA transferase [Geobacteraceae bacterium]|nr:CoA transferase [Geobacteraceae bacterium]
MGRWKNIEKVPAPHFIPKYGPLSGMRVLMSATVVAAPFGASLLSEMGAEIIQVEFPNIGDPFRKQYPPITHEEREISAGWVQNARNRLSFTLNTNLKYPEAKEIFLSLIKNADVWLENIVWLDKLGITEELLFEVNPKLIIAHVSGFGRPQFGGIPEICDKPSYDNIGQAEGGYTFLNGFPEPSPPTFAASFYNDYLTAMFTAFGITAAYANVLRGGQGQVVDIAQVEAQARVLDDAWTVYANMGIVKQRFGNKVPIFQPGGVYKAKDGRYISLGAFGNAVYSRFLKALDLDIDYFNYEAAGATREAVNSSLGQELRNKTDEWIASRTAHECYEHLNKFKVPCGIAKTTEEIYNDPHWQSRGNFIKYTDETLGKEVEAFGFVPKLSGTPQKVWRGAPRLGQDTEVIMSQLLGYSDAEISSFKGKGIID